MRKVFLLILIILQSFFFAACGGYETVRESETSETSYEQKKDLKKQTIEKLENSKKVWQYYIGDMSVPENEIIIEDITDSCVTFSFLAYRLDAFMNKNGVIKDNGVIYFEHIFGNMDNASISGNIQVNEDNMVLTVSDSNHLYFKNGTKIIFTCQSDKSILQ